MEKILTAKEIAAPTIYNPDSIQMRLWDLMVFFPKALRYIWRNRRYITAYKLYNIAVVNFEYLMRKEVLRGLPYLVKIEPTNICNSNCQLCPTGRGFHGRSKGRMSFERYKYIVDQIKDFAYVLDLSNWGDPLVVPEIYDMIRYAHESGLWTYISSNLHAFSIKDGDADRLVSSGLDMLNCSLHAATDQTYKIYQPGKSLYSVIEKIEAIQDAKKRLGRKRPVVQLYFVVMRHNEGEMGEFVRLAHELGCRAVFSKVSLNLRFIDKDKTLKPLGLSEEEKNRRIKEIKERWLPRNPAWVPSWYNGGIKGKRSWFDIKPIRCSWPWRNIVINWNGDVTVCCGVFNPAYVLGNVFERPIREIWNDIGYRLSRRSFKVPLEDRRAEPCASCIGVLP